MWAHIAIRPGAVIATRASMQMANIVAFVLAALFCIFFTVAPALEQPDVTTKFVFDALLKGSRLLQVCGDATKTASTTTTEERADVQGLVKLAELDNKASAISKFATHISNKMRISLGKDPEYVYQSLKLYLGGEKLNENEKVTQWFRFVKEYRDAKGSTKFPESEIHFMLQKTAREPEVAAALQSLKSIPGLKKLAETMQKYQFMQWIHQKATPRKVAAMLAASDRGPTGKERDEIYNGFTSVYNALRVN